MKVKRIQWICLAVLMVLSSVVYAGGATEAAPIIKSVPNPSQGWFPKNQVSFSFYDSNSMRVSIKHPPSPIFWTASTEPDSGFMFMYERNIYHTKKHFSINVGASFSRWELNRQDLYALSALVTFRFWLFRSESFNPYIIYSIAGPTFISRRHFGPANLGENFLFQDLLGFGIQFGKKHPVNLAAILVHYSNGDIFTSNNGFDVPIVFSLGFAF